MISLRGIFMLALVMAGCGSVTAQLSVPGRPLPIEYSGAPQIPFVVLESKQTESDYSPDEGGNDTFRLKNAISGELIGVSISPDNSGVWHTLPDGTRVWRTGIEVRNASLINIIFSPWRLKEGAKVFLYDPGQKNVRGAFTEINNKNTGLLATSSIPGQTIIIELQVPPDQEFGELGISGIGCDFRNLTEKDGWFGESGVCNPDIMCSIDPVVGTVKNSVVRIVYKGHERCTGTLVNTVQNHKINYILTAGHCFTTEEDAKTAVFYFEYESPSCDGPDGDATKSLSGATIRSRSSDVDFALLELLEPIPVSYHPYYAGWDNSGMAPQSAFVIHHPLGDVKKIAEDQDPLTIATFGNRYDPKTHWLVDKWESGTTEPGSSGAPLFDRNGLLQGTLTGGLADCDDPSNDYFQMFSHSWSDYPEPERQLAIWLDPLKTKRKSLAGYDPGNNTPGPAFEDFAVAYPNPASTVIQVRFREMIPEPVQISMYNLQGQMVYDQSFGAYQHMIPVSLYGISDGIYIIRIRMINEDRYIKVAVLK